MFKTGLTRSLYSNFIAEYQSTEIRYEPSTPYVYVDRGVVKLLANLFTNDSDSDEFFAVGVAQDGLVEFLSIE